MHSLVPTPKCRQAFGSVSIDGNQFCNVAVQVRESLIKGGESAVVRSRQLCKVRISHLSMTNDTGEPNFGERQTVRPEFVPRVARNSGDDLLGETGRLSVSDQKTNQTALRYRTGCEFFLTPREPFHGRLMMNVIGNHQCNKDVGIEQRRHSSSSSDLTSSEVITVPRLTTGRPVLGLCDTSAWEPKPKPRRRRSAIVSLNVRWVSRAIACACLCRSSGKSIVVRIIASYHHCIMMRAARATRS